MVGVCVCVYVCVFFTRTHTHSDKLWSSSSSMYYLKTVQHKEMRRRGERGREEAGLRRRGRKGERGRKDNEGIKDEWGRGFFSSFWE